MEKYFITAWSGRGRDISDSICGRANFQEILVTHDLILNVPSTAVLRIAVFARLFLEDREFVKYFSQEIVEFFKSNVVFY